MRFPKKKKGKTQKAYVADNQFPFLLLLHACNIVKLNHYARYQFEILLQDEPKVHDVHQGYLLRTLYINC